VFVYDEASGLDAEEWCDRLQGRRIATRLHLPHDARARSFNSRHSTVEVFLQKGKHVAEQIVVNSQRKKQDSINAGRMVLKCTRFDGTACATLLDALRSYHFKYDEEQRIFSSEPEHDWSSHGSDAFMEGAAALQDFVEEPPPPPPDRQLTAPLNYAFALDDLWKHAPGQGTRRV